MSDIPAGYWKDSKGRLIPDSMVSDLDKARDELVQEIVRRSLEMRALLSRFKGEVMGDIEAFVTLSGEQYGADIGGAKGNVTLTSYDGKHKVKRAISENLVFDERLQTAKSLIDDCLREWSEGSRPEIKAIVSDAFQVDQEGKLNVGRILSLRRLDISDPRWQRAMQAISDGLTVAGTKAYIRVYEADESGQWHPISLDLATV